MRVIRRKRLTELLASSRFNGDRSKFCSSTRLSKGRLTQLLDPNEAFGDIAARNLCDRLELPQGWFDSDPQQTQATPPTAPAQETAPVAMSAECKMIFDMFAALPDDPVLRGVVVGKFATIIAEAREPPEEKQKVLKPPGDKRDAA